MTVDRLSVGENTSRAAVVHAHTLEVLEPLGVSATLIAEGIKVPIFRVRDRGNVPLTIDFREIPSVYAYTLMCPQNRIEARPAREVASAWRECASSRRSKGH